MILKEKMTIVSQTAIAEEIFELVLTGDLVENMKQAGQFLHLLVPGADKLLRRPISIARINPQAQTVTLIYRAEGAGTHALADLPVGGSIDVMGPLGKGFETAGLASGQTAFLIAGGIGTPPMLELSERLKTQGVRVVHLLGYANQGAIFHQAWFEGLGETRIATVDGSAGHQGHVGHLIETALADFGQPDAVFACGPNGLLKAVDQRFEDHPKAYLSMEARMACGIGACYACVVPVKHAENHSLKVCDQGPVFKTGKLVLK